MNGYARTGAKVVTGCAIETLPTQMTGATTIILLRYAPLHFTILSRSIKIAPLLSLLQFLLLL